MTAVYYPIDESAARRANDMNSMRDYEPGSATAGYRAAVDSAAALVEAQKAKTSLFYHEKLDALQDHYARRLADYYNAYYRNESACPSILISGGSNFPTRKKEKQNARRDTLHREFEDIQGILEQIKSVGTGCVDLADPHARDILTEQLSRESTALETAKSANAYYRKHKTLEGCPGVSAQSAEWMTRPGWAACGSFLDLHGCPFPGYALQSIRGKIKRIQARLADLDKRQASQDNPENEIPFDGGTVIKNFSEDRLQIVFSEKPDDDTRAKLKAHGFRWSPKSQAWQRQLTKSAEWAARQILEFPQAPAPDEWQPDDVGQMPGTAPDDLTLFDL